MNELSIAAKLLLTVGAAVPVVSAIRPGVTGSCQTWIAIEAIYAVN